MGGTKKPPHLRKEHLKKVAAAQRRKQKHQERLRRLAAVNQIAKETLNETAVELFGEGGLTPARREALSAVLVGPEGGQLTPTNATNLRVLVRKAREVFINNAERYMKTHIEVVEKAFEKGELELAAKHAEWAMDRIGDEDERITTPPQQSKVVTQSPPQTIQMGVNLGGLPPQK